MVNYADLVFFFLVSTHVSKAAALSKSSCSLAYLRGLASLNRIYCAFTVKGSI